MPVGGAEIYFDRPFKLVSRPSKQTRHNVSIYIKKKKVDSENRQFNNEWTEKYSFITVNEKPFVSNLQRLLTLSLLSHRAPLPRGRRYMSHVVLGLYRSREGNGSIFASAMDIGQKAFMEVVVTDEKTRKSIIDLIKQIPISDASNKRRIEWLALNVFEMLVDKLRFFFL